MQKSLFIIGLMASLSLTSCQNDKEEIVYPTAINQNSIGSGIDASLLNPSEKIDGKTGASSDTSTEGRVSTGAADRETEPSMNIDPKSSCGRFLENKKVEILAQCNKVLEGRLKKIYKYELNKADLCIVKQSYPSEDVVITSVVGTFSESDKGGKAADRDIDVFAASKITEDMVSFENWQNKLKTTVEYNIQDQTLHFKQVKNKVFRKLLRSAKLECELI